MAEGTAPKVKALEITSSPYKSTGLEEEHECGSAGVEGDTVLVASVFADLDFGLGYDGFLAFSDVVAVHASSLHEFNGSLLSLERNRVGGLDVSSDDSSFSSFRDGTESSRSTKASDEYKSGCGKFGHGGK